MGNYGSYNSVMPSGSSSIKDGDDLLRSHWSVLENALDTEHFFNSTSASSASAGVHRLGSARPFYGAYSSMSTFGDTGRVFVTSDESRLWYMGRDAIFPLGPRAGGLIEHFTEAVSFNTSGYVWMEQSGSGGNQASISFGTHYDGVAFVTYSVRTNSLVAIQHHLRSQSTTSFEVYCFDTSNASLTASTVSVDWRSLGSVLLSRVTR